MAVETTAKTTQRVAEPTNQAWTVAFRGDRTETIPPGGAPPVVKMEKVAEKPAPTAFDKKAADRRADFIAAARPRGAGSCRRGRRHRNGTGRRAGNARRDELCAGRERKPGAFQRISQAIRSRKRPMLLAAAAIVLAIGAMQLYAQLAPITPEPLVASAAKVVVADGAGSLRPAPTSSRKPQPSPSTSPAAGDGGPADDAGRGDGLRPARGFRQSLPVGRADATVLGFL